MKKLLTLGFSGEDDNGIGMWRPRTPNHKLPYFVVDGHTVYVRAYYGWRQIALYSKSEKTAVIQALEQRGLKGQLVEISKKDGW